MRVAYVHREPVQGSRHKYVEMFSRVCNLEPVPCFEGNYDLAIMVGVNGNDYKDLKRYNTPYILIANDVGGMRWSNKRDLEAQIVLEARAVLTNTPETLEWMQREYGLVGGETVLLRPLARDLDFEPLPKLPGKNIVYAGGLTAETSRYDYRNYLDIFPMLQAAGWTVHLYPSWGHTNDLSKYRDIDCVVHDAVPQNQIYREMSQYQAGFQGYGFGKQQDYIEAARPNKLWEYQAAGIPTLGYNTGRGGALYDGKWGIVAKTPEDIPTASEAVLAMTISEETRRQEVIDTDLDTFYCMIRDVGETRPTITVGIIGQGNIGGQVSMVPPEVRKLGVECYGFSRWPSKFKYPLDEHKIDPSPFLLNADIIQVAVSHKMLDLFPHNPDAQLVVHQHGHMGRPKDAPLSDLELDKEKGAIRIVSTLNLLKYVDGDVERWMPSMVNPLVETLEKVERDDGLVRVVHSPSRRSNKHTEEIIAAVELLQALGDPVELHIIENVSIEESIRQKALGDICFDQLDLCYGQSAVECMFLGIPVIVGMDDETDALVQEVTEMQPYLRATKLDLALKLHSLVVDAEARKEIGEVGRTYARRYHSAKAVGERRAAFYRRIMANGPIQKSGPKVDTRPPLKYPVPLAHECRIGDVVYPKGTSVDRPTALLLKQAGELTDSRIV